MHTHVDRGTAQEALTKFAREWTDQIEEWRASGQAHTEKSYAQQFWSALLRCFGVIPERMYLFERDATRASTGGTGYIDFFWSGVAIGEAKSLGKDLGEAHRQALDYLSGGSIQSFEWPKFVLVTNFSQLRIDRLGDDPWTVEFDLADAPAHVDQLLFLAGQETVTKAEEKAASLDAAARMAALWQALVGDEADEAVGDEAPTNPEDEDALAHEASVLLTRLLFLLYGDDAGLWEADLFRRWVEYDTTADNLGPQLQGLFTLLNTPGSQRRRVPDTLAKFPYVNGGIFDGATPVPFLNAEMREALIEACRFRWTHISPAVFGALFQLVKSKEARRGDGEHYTSEANILKTIGPLFLDEYRTRADRLITKKSASRKEFDDLQNELASNLYVDPACGAGNFLNVAYARLRAIETDLIVERSKRWGTMDLTYDVMSFEQKLTIDRFWGFEINWWPAKIAETAMFLVDHQANLALAKARGSAPDRLPITITAHIVHHDALTLDWKESLPEPKGQTYIFGNPPFLGDHTRTPAQLALMQAAWGGNKQLSRLDFVTSWHALTLRLLADRYGEWAFVTTNSITQGDQAARLFQPIVDAGWRIKFAHRTFQWDSEAPGKAAVHCVIVGFTRDRAKKRRLWDYLTAKSNPLEAPAVKTINAYLVDGPEVLVGKRTTPLAPDLPEVVKGSMATDGGNLIITPEDYGAVMADPVMAPYVRPYVGSKQLLSDRKRWCLWLREMNPGDPARSPELKRRLEGVAAMRQASSAATTRDWARFPHLFRQLGLLSEVPFVGIPEVSSENRYYLPVAHFEPEVIISNKVYGAIDPHGIVFAVASSSMFWTWMKTVGGRMKSDPSFSSTITWNNFPMPALTSEQRAGLASAGTKILNARAQHPGRSLEEHYAPLSMTPELVRAHDQLDTIMDRIIGASRRCRATLERQELLFASYVNMTSNVSTAPNVGRASQPVLAGRR
ncbi:DNA methyltransferase [Kocuria arenosa]|uniref:DNA methyltransferase n=1 Tax=Kocuria arenosa TaxID=3071446 RepID=UPI0034D3F583